MKNIINFPSKQTIHSVIITLFLALGFLSAKAADENLSLSQTVSWINATLREGGGSGVIFCYDDESDSSGSQSWYENYSISISTDGTLKIKWERYCPGHKYGEEIRQKDETLNFWRNLTPVDVQVVKYGQTLDATFNDMPRPNLPAIGARTSVIAVVDEYGRYWCVVPNASDHMLDAFRHLLEKTKEERDNPFK